MFCLYAVSIKFVFPVKEFFFLVFALVNFFFYFSTTFLQHFSVFLLSSLLRVFVIFLAQLTNHIAPLKPISFHHFIHGYFSFRKQLNKTLARPSQCDNIRSWFPFRTPFSPYFLFRHAYSIAARTDVTNFPTETNWFELIFNVRQSYTNLPQLLSQLPSRPLLFQMSCLINQTALEKKVCRSSFYCINLFFPILL